MKILRSLPLCALASALLGTAAMAQSAAPAVRIDHSIDNSQLVTLKGNVNPHANAQNDRGAVTASLPMSDMTLVLSRSPEQQAAFDAYVQSEYDSGSPNFHKWLTPAQIGTQYGPAQSDIATIVSWLAGQGFAVKQVAPDGMTIKFAGTAGLVESAFHTQIHNLSVKGVAHYANMTDPQIPAALASVVVGVKALHNFLPHPLHRQGAQVEFNKQLGKWQRVVTSSKVVAPASGTKPAVVATTAGPHPLFGINAPASQDESAYLEEDVTPWDFATIYNVTPVWTAGYTGTGQTIAIAGTSEINENDVNTFRSTFGLAALPSSNFQQINTNGLATTCTSTSPEALCGIGDLDENTLDVEWSGAVAPGAKIDLVVTGQNSAGSIDTVYDSAQYVVQNVTAKILNLSYGECELFQGTTENVAFYDLWQSAAAEGISVFVAAGDSGSPSCDDGGDAVGNPYSAQYGLSVSGLASTPYNVAVGGTDFSWCKPTLNSSGDVVGCPSSSSSQGSPAYWATTNQSSTSAQPYESALGYVPEIPWNDSCLNPIIGNYLASIAPLVTQATGSVATPTNAEATCNYVQNYWYDIYEGYGVALAPYIDTVGGSGGSSSCVVNTTNPDSESAGVCTPNPGTTGAANGSIPLVNDGWPAPTWQVNSGVTGTSGLTTRALPDVSFFAGDGTLDSAYLVCISAEGSCTYSPTSENDEEEFGGTSFASPAMSGVMALIDQKAGAAQGLPTPEFYKLAYLQGSTNCSAETVGNSNTSCYFHSIDEGTNAMPCDNGATVGGYLDGSIYEEYAGINSPNCAALNSGDQVGTLVSSGTTAAFNAVAGFNMATGLGTMNVANVVTNWTSDAGTATATMTLTTTPAAGSSGTITLGSGVSLVIAATVAGSGSLGTPTGSITVSGGGYSTNVTLASGAASITIPAGSMTPGTDTLTIIYSGDANYASLTQTETVAAAAAIPVVTVNAPATDNVANSVLVTVGVTGPAGSTSTPAGSVSLSGGGYSSPGVVTLSSSGTASFTIPAGALAAGTDTLTATYQDTVDTKYAGATGMTTIVMATSTLLTPTIKVTPSPTSIDTSQSLSVTVNASGTGTSAPTGYVTLTSGTGSGSYSSGPTALTGGVATITIPANSLAAGTDTLTASYLGDSEYGPASGTASVTVTQSTYTLSATTPSAIAPGATATSTITGVASTTGYTGTVTLNTCTLTSSSVTSPNSPPTCSVSGTITYAAGAASGSGTALVSTTAASAALVYPTLGNGKGWLGGGGAVLAFLVFLGIPARRKSWRAMLGTVVLLVALGSLVACGGGSTNSGSGGTSISATSAGTYTFTVSGTASPSVGTAPTTTFTVTVN